MSEYSIPNSVKPQLTRRLLKLIPMMALASVPAILFALAWFEPLAIILGFIVVTTTMTIGFFRGIKAATTAIPTIDREQISLASEGRSTITIDRSDIKRIVELPDGHIIVESTDPTVKIPISPYFDNQENLRTELGSYSPLQTEGAHKYSRSYAYFWLVLMIVFSLGAFVFQIEYSYYLLIAGFLPPFGYYLLQKFRSRIVVKDKMRKS